MDEMELTVGRMVREGKGILAADESLPTIAKRFAQFGIESNEENRRSYRSLLFSAPDIDQYISGVILFEETLKHRDEKGMPLPELLSSRGIVPGIKVDKGTVPLANSPGDKITEGLDGLSARLANYKMQGARFAKWREVYSIGERNPSAIAIDANAEMLARYAAICQEEKIVPIVEPEVLIDGGHSMERCLDVTEAVLHAVFHALHRHGVILECMLLKPSMILPGKDFLPRASPDRVAESTLKVLKRTVPAAVPSINFLSGGQGPEEATANLNAMNALFPNPPWALSFSYGRALQSTALEAWGGKKEHSQKMQEAFLKRAKLNGLARSGKYGPELEAE